MGFSVALKELIKDKVTLVAGEYVLIEGHRGISEYTSENIAVRISGGKLYVSGENLGIKEMNGEEIHIEGKVKSVERRRGGEN